MDQTTLGIEEIEAGAELVRQFESFASVDAAFWLKASDEPNRFLYIASEHIDDKNFDVAYGEVLRLARTMRSPYLDPFRVKLVGKDDPLAKEAIGIIGRFPGPMATHFYGSWFGGLSVDDVYIYPSPLPAGSA